MSIILRATINLVFLSLKYKYILITKPNKLPQNNLYQLFHII